MLLVLAGPSGVGKGTVIGAMKTICPQLLGREISVSISKTTRKPRVGEEEAVHYYFTDRESFLAEVENGAFYEHAEYAGNLYGTPRAPIEERINAGEIVVLDIDTQGAFQVRDTAEHALLVFLLPPSMEELERRLRGRQTDSEEAICRRLEIARKECELSSRFDAAVYNIEIEQAAKDVCGLIEAKLKEINS
ncbi:MAG: guanylate kinase [Clostridia bacterium]|nr:guanylate kinase [Clostridia bacterium]